MPCKIASAQRSRFLQRLSTPLLAADILCHFKQRASPCLVHDLQQAFWPVKEPPCAREQLRPMFADSEKIGMAGRDVKGWITAERSYLLATIQSRNRYSHSHASVSPLS
jgi:hypothetical protein